MTIAPIAGKRLPSWWTVGMRMDSGSSSTRLSVRAGSGSSQVSRAAEATSSGGCYVRRVTGGREADRDVVLRWPDRPVGVASRRWLSPG